jgi:hypothetical protein
MPTHAPLYGQLGTDSTGNPYRIDTTNIQLENRTLALP